MLVRFILTTLLKAAHKLIIFLTLGKWKMLSCSLKPVLEFTCIETHNVSAAQIVSCVWQDRTDRAFFRKGSETLHRRDKSATSSTVLHSEKS